MHECQNCFAHKLIFSTKGYARFFYEPLEVLSDQFGPSNIIGKNYASGTTQPVPWQGTG